MKHPLLQGLHGAGSPKSHFLGPAFPISLYGAAVGFPARVYTCTRGPVYAANQEHPHKQPKASGSPPASFWGERRGRPDAW